MADVKDLCSNYDMVFLQETWLSKQNLDFLTTVTNSHYSWGNSSVDDSLGIRKGRLYGGTAIFWKKNLNLNRVTSHSGSIIGLKLEMASQSVIFLNVYLPYCLPSKS